MEKILEMSQPFVFNAINLDSKPVSDFPKISRELVIEGAVTGTQGACSVPSCLKTTGKFNPGFLEMQDSKNFPKESRGLPCYKWLDRSCVTTIHLFLSCLQSRPGLSSGRPGAPAFHASASFV